MTWSIDGDCRHRLVDDRLGVRRTAAAQRAVGGRRARSRREISTRAAIASAPKPENSGITIAPIFGNREHRDRRLGHVRQVGRDDVAAPEAERTQAFGAAAHRAIEIAIAEAALARRSSPTQSSAVRVVGRRAAPAIERVQRDVGRAADAPARPRRALRRVEHRVVGTVEAVVDVLAAACRGTRRDRHRRAAPARA